MLRSVIVLAGLLAPTFAGAGGEAAFRLQDDVVPTFQEIYLKVDAAQPAYSGKVAFELDVRKSVRQFHFHSEGPQIQALRLSADGVEVELTDGLTHVELEG
ncbi:MAG: hypothetical protein AAFY88_10050, partial [Acidobacteriota bacterium]